MNNTQKMKNSGIEWIGEIPVEWEVVKLLKLYKERKVKNVGNKETNVLSLSYGNIKKRNVETNMGLLPESFETYNIIEPSNIVLRLTDLQNDHKSLRCGLVKEKGIITSAYVTLEKKIENISSDYYYRLLHTFDIMKGFYSMGDGVRQNLKYDGELCNLYLIKPPFNTQTRIAEYLDKKCGEIDKSIALQRRAIEKLKEYKQSLISKCVTGKLSINSEPNTQKMKNSGIEWIGEIPVEWERTKLKRLLATPITDGPHETPTLLDSGVPFLSAEAVKNHKLNFDLKRGFISYDEHNRFCKKCKPQLNDIFMVKSGATTGNIAIVDTEEEFSIWSPLALIRANKDCIFYKFLFYYLQSDNFRKQVELFWSYGTQQNIGMEVLGNLYVSYPLNLNTQTRIAEYLDKKCAEIDAVINGKEQVIEKLDEYKKSLIYECVTGKMRV